MANSTFTCWFYIFFCGYSSIPRSPAFSTKPFEKHHFQRTLIALLRPLPRETLRHTTTCLPGESTCGENHGWARACWMGKSMANEWWNHGKTIIQAYPNFWQLWKMRLWSYSTFSFKIQSLGKKRNMTIFKVGTIKLVVSVAWSNMLPWRGEDLTEQHPQTLATLQNKRCWRKHCPVWKWLFQG